MIGDLAPWTRPRYVAGGPPPFLFYAIYGRIDLHAPLSRGTYRCAGPPAGLDVMSYGPGSHQELVDRFRSGPLWDQLAEERPSLATAVEACDRCVVIRGSPEDPSTLDYLRDAVGLITHLVDHGGCAVYDPLRLTWWEPATWRCEVFAPAAPVPKQHTVILVSDEDGASTQWFHTRGMRKFGRPDISIRQVDAARRAGVIELCDRLIQVQVEGAIVPDGQEIRMVSLPGGGRMRTAGSVEDPDFDNAHLSVTLG
jgi:hypothetical protein